jgi:tetratricopeptide (TPR) repeat protein
MSHAPVIDSETQDTQNTSEQALLVHLAKAVSLHLRGNTGQALLQLPDTPPPGGLAAEVYSARGHLQLEMQAFGDAARDFSRLLELQPESASAQYHLAHCFQQQNSWEDAERLFQAAAKSDKYRFASLLGAGICLLHLKRPHDALTAFGLCLEQNPNHEQALLGRGVALQLVWDFDGAITSYRAVLEKNPRSTESLVNLITLGMQRKDPALAQEYAKRLLEIDPESEPAWEGMVFAAFQRDEYEAAITGCTKLVELHPERFDHTYNLGVALQNSGRHDAAEAAYRKAVEIRPDAVQAWVNLGVLLQDTQRIPEAIQIFEKAIEGSPDREDLKVQVALLVEKTGDLQEAESRYSRLVERNATLSYVWFRLGYLQLQRGASDLAAKAFQACVRLRPAWPEAEVNLALAHWRLNGFEASEAVLDKLIQREPENIDAVRGLASTCLALQKTDKAHYYHERLTELGDSSAEVMYNKGLLAQRMGRRTEAIASYRAALSTNPDFCEALINLGHVLQEEGHGEAASECWDKALALKPELAKGYFTPA